MQAEVAIIGAGPIGIELAIAFKRNGISYIQFDKGQAGQMIYNFPPHTHFFSSPERISIAGIPIQTVDQQKCSREKYLAYLRSVIMHYDLQLNTYENVFAIKKLEGSRGFTLTTCSLTGEQKEYKANYLVIASGGTSQPRQLNVRGEKLPHVSTKMEDPHRYFQKKVLIIGGRNSAVESALRCFHAGAEVTMAAREDQFNADEIKYWLLPELLGRIKKNEIACFYGTQVREIKPSKVLLERKKEGSCFFSPADFVIKTIGFEADMNLFLLLGIPLQGERKTPHFNSETMETSEKDVFVLGTVVGGTQQKYRVFIENCHEHVEKILMTLASRMGLKNISFSITRTASVSPSVHLEE